jgi:cofilin
MALTGIKVADECVTAFNEMKQKKQSRFVIFKIVNNEAVKVAHVSERTATYDDFVAYLNQDKDDPFYAVFDFEMEAEGVTRGKLLLLSWIPDTAKVRSKMVYASTKESLKAKIDGGLMDIQANDFSSICYDAVAAKVKSTLRF